MIARLGRILSRMFGPNRPPRDPQVATTVSESRAEAAEARDLLEQIRGSAERRRLAHARRNYEERLHGARDT